MLRIVVFSGGTGSIALQKGLDQVFGHGMYHLDVIINAYDNGKSTGMCRRAFKNAILGPSDLRKNQLTEFSLKWKKEIADRDSYHSRLYSLFNMRIDAEDYEDYWQKASSIIDESAFLHPPVQIVLKELLRKFIFENQERLADESFKDVALSNIFYAQVAHDNGDSLSKAGSFMARLLDIEDRVHLISDVSLLLKARTRSGTVIEDEGKIVDWSNSRDRIADIFLVDPATGKERIPIVDEGNAVNRVQNVISSADIVIFSSGTQWSSLIPTYVHSGFTEMIHKSKARKYLVMNNVPDKDMAGLNAADVLWILKKWIPLDDATVVFNKNASYSMQWNSMCSAKRHISGTLSDEGSRTHDPVQLIECIFSDFFGLKKGMTLVSDLDGTIIEARGDAEAKMLGEENMSLFNGIILTGNTKSHVRKHVKFHDGIEVYCDYGMRRINEHDSEAIVPDSFRMDENVIRRLESLSEFKGKVHSRNGYALTVKPLASRSACLEKINSILQEWNGRYKALIAGKTSIDVLSSDCSKMSMLLRILDIHHLQCSDILYIGNELEDEDGNDYCINRLGVRTLNVRGIEEFNNIVRLWHMMSEVV